MKRNILGCIAIALLVMARMAVGQFTVPKATGANATVPISGPTHVQSLTGGGSATFGSSIIAGDTIVVTTVTVTAVPTVTDSLSNTYNNLASVSAPGSANHVTIWAAYNVHGGSNTITVSGGSYDKFAADEFTGVTASPYDGVASATHGVGSGSLTAGPISTSGTSDLLYSVAANTTGNGSSPVFTTPSGYVTYTNNVGLGDFIFFSTAGLNSQPSGSYTAVWSWTNSTVNVGAFILALK